MFTGHFGATLIVALVLTSDKQYATTEYYPKNFIQIPKRMKQPNRILMTDITTHLKSQCPVLCNKTCVKIHISKGINTKLVNPIPPNLVKMFKAASSVGAT